MTPRRPVGVHRSVAAHDPGSLLGQRRTLTLLSASARHMLDKLPDEPHDHRRPLELLVASYEQAMAAIDEATRRGAE